MVGVRLADNGGFTHTHAIAPGSPALDAGDDTACVGPDNDTDQRGEPRPVDGEEDTVTPFCDVGAYEYQPPLGLVVNSTPPVTEKASPPPIESMGLTRSSEV